jgi:hypothetical protein
MAYWGPDDLSKYSLSSMMPVAHACNPRYSEGRDQEDWNTQHTNRAGGVAQVLECWPSKHEALSSNSSTTKNWIKKVPFPYLISLNTTDDQDTLDLVYD